MKSTSREKRRMRRAQRAIKRGIRRKLMPLLKGKKITTALRAEVVSAVEETLRAIYEPPIAAFNVERDPNDPTCLLVTCYPTDNTPQRITATFLIAKS